MPPLITRTAGGFFLTHNATVTGDVVIGELSSIWFTTVIRGDVAPIRIGRRVNVQDGAVIHVDGGVKNEIDDDVSIGHRAIIHGKRVGRGSLIGMGATVLSGSIIGEECLIGAGAVIPPNMTVPDRSVIMGIPGRIARQVTEKDLAYMRTITAAYVELSQRYERGEFPPNNE